MITRVCMLGCLIVELTDPFVFMVYHQALMAAYTKQGSLVEQLWQVELSFPRNYIFVHIWIPFEDVSP